MEPNNQYGTVVTNNNNKWQLRWGHILLALFFIVLIIIAYIVVHQIKTADKGSQTASNSGHHATTSGSKTSGSHKAPASSGSKSTNHASNSNSSSTKSETKSSSSPSTSTPAPSSSSATPLANTGPGDTVGLFIGVTVIGASLHYLYTKHRLSGLSK